MKLYVLSQVKIKFTRVNVLKLLLAYKENAEHFFGIKLKITIYYFKMNFILCYFKMQEKLVFMTESSLLQNLKKKAYNCFAMINLCDSIYLMMFVGYSF